MLFPPAEAHSGASQVSKIDLCAKAVYAFKLTLLLLQKSFVRNVWGTLITFLACSNAGSIECTPPWQKGGGRGGWKKYGLGTRFQKLKGGPYYQEGADFSKGQVGAKFLEWARFSRATMFFCKRVISVATLLLVIYITMYILKWY